MKHKNGMIDIVCHVISNLIKLIIFRAVKLFSLLKKKNPYHKNALLILVIRFFV